MSYAFVVLVKETPGVLTRVISLFRRLNVNINSLASGKSETAGISRITIVSSIAEDRVHRFLAAMHKISDILEIDHVHRHSAVIRELALLKVEAGSETRSDLFLLAKVFHASIIDLTPDSIMLEIVGSANKIEGLVQILNRNKYRILEMARTGHIAMCRGHDTSRVAEAFLFSTRNRSSHTSNESVLANNAGS